MTRNASVELSISTRAYPQFTGPAKKLSQDDLLKQSHGQYHQSLCHITGICLQAGGVLKLGNELSVQENGSHGYLGKIYGKQEIIPKTVISCLHAEGVNQPRNLLEGKKADPHRKEKPCKGNVLTQKRVQVLYKEIRVFKVKKQGQIGAYAKYQNHPPAGPDALFTIRPAGRLTIPLAVSLFPSPASTLETAQLNTALPTSSPRYHGFA